MVKRTTSVYADPDKIKRAEQLGFPLSKLLDNSLDAVLDGEFDDIVVNTRILIIDETIKLQKLKLAELSIQLVQTEKQVEQLITSRQDLLHDWEHARNNTILTSKIRLINQKLIRYNFKPEPFLVDWEPLVEEVIAINPKFNIVKHAARMKRIMDD